MEVEETLAALEAVADPTRRPGMARVGIDVEHALGVSVPEIRRIAKRAGTDQELADALWASGVHEARILATLVADAAAIGRARMEAWAIDIDSWDVGDFAADLFAATPERDRIVAAWAERAEPYVKRCAFAMIARRAVSDKGAPDGAFVQLLPTIARAARDDRNEVKKAVSWALRQIGKRNRALHAAAVTEAERMLEEALASGSRGARWVARDVLRELRNPATIGRLRS
jgi:3-methyladenine DNA glycosylase AlkD